MAKKVVKKSKKKTVSNHKRWQVGKNVGRGLGSGAGVKRKIESPEKLWDLFLEYKAWAKQNPYKKHTHWVKGKKIYQELERALTFIGFEGYLCNNEIVYDLSHYEGAVDYRPIVKLIKKACGDDTISGAMAGVYNAGIASRLEGLTDNQKVVVEDNRKEVGDLFPLDDKE